MYDLLFIGAGKMATAIAAGMTAKGFDANRIAAFDVDQKNADAFFKKTKIECFTNSFTSIVEQSRAVLIAVKPQNLSDAVTGTMRDKLVISIVAGVSIAKLNNLSKSQHIVRVMPNTPALIGEGATAYAMTANVTDTERQFAQKILNTIGLAIELDEKHLDTVTALSGSGPAYVFEFIQALTDGAVAEGLPRDIALTLAVQTIIGSAKMVKETKNHPTVLRDQVTSPGGTTIRALEALAENNFANSVIKAVRAAAERSRELGKI